MRRRGAPTLYELSKGSGRSSMTSGSGGLSGGSTPSISLLGHESARSVRVPVGFLWLLGVAVLGFSALTYAFGVGRGRASGYAEGVSAQLTENNTRAMARTVNDPMKQGAASVSVTPQKPLPAVDSKMPANSVTVNKSAAQNNSKADSKSFTGIEGVTASQVGNELHVSIEGDVLFDSGKTALKENAKKSLDKVAAILKDKYAGKYIRVAGFTDTDPIKKSGFKDNYYLGFDRAYSVREYIIKKGLEGNVISLSSFGPDVPLKTKAQSRRVEVIVVSN